MPKDFSADSFHIKKLSSRYLREKRTYWGKTSILRFWVPLWELRVNVYYSSQAHWKARSGHPILVTGSSAIAERLRCSVGQFWPKVEDDILHTIYRSICNQCDVIGLQSYQIQWNKAK